MKRAILTLIAGLTLFACNNSSTDEANTDEAVDTARTGLNEIYADNKKAQRQYTLTGLVEQDIYFLVPEGIINGDLMRVTYNEKYKEIVLRLKNKAQNNKEWFEEFYEKGKQKGEVEYDPKLGITEEEFIYINTYKGDFTKIAELTLRTEVDGKDVIVNCDKLPDYDSIRFVMRDYYVVLNNVACKYQGTFEVTEANFPGGMKKGHLWKYEYFGGSGDKKVEQIYEVRLAEIKGTGDIMFYVGIHDVNSEKQVDKEYVLIYPPLNKKQS